MIDWGLPAKRDDWPDGVLEALRHWRQGDVVESPPAFHHAGLDRTVWGRDALKLDEADVVVWDEPVAPPFGVVTTQTCDIGEEDAPKPRRPFVQIAPVYDMSTELNSGLRGLLERERGPMFLVHVPSLTAPGFWVADLRIEFPSDKGWLARNPPIVGFADERHRERFGERLANLRGRPAFGGSFVDSIQRTLVDFLKDLRADDAELFAKIDAEVRELGVRVDSRLQPSIVEPVFLCENPPSAKVRDALARWWDVASEAADQVGITLQALRVVPLDDVSAKFYLGLTVVPLVRFSAP